MDITEYIEPVFRFCLKRLDNRHDAEDLASEIMVHILNGIKKYHIDNLESWVWRIAHNRYARFIDMKNKRREMPSDDEMFEIPDDYDFVDEIIIADEFQQVFKYLHTLSSEYRNILVDYYIGQLPVKRIAENYGLTETTVKWRLNVSREKIKTRIGENKMDKVYKRINWNTDSCNGSMDSDRYLHRQVARAICEAAYEKPLNVEEISLATGLPTMYIEDELPKLIYGDAIAQEGNKYATDFIILRQCDKEVMVKKFNPLVADIADYFTELFTQDVSNLGFYGADFGMENLGYIAVPAVIRGKVGKIKANLNISSGAYPPRKDGGYGWFIVEEGDTNYSGGCNVYGKGEDTDRIYYYSIGKYFSHNINNMDDWISDKKIIRDNGFIDDSVLTEDERVILTKANLITENKLNFAVFTKEQFDSFTNLFNKDAAKLDKMLADLITDIHRSFKAFVPKRLDSQINQWVSCYVHNIIGFVAEELINRGVLEQPDDEIPLTNGVFCIRGSYVEV